MRIQRLRQKYFLTASICLRYATTENERNMKPVQYYTGSFFVHFQQQQHGTTACILRSLILMVALFGCIGFTI